MATAIQLVAFFAIVMEDFDSGPNFFEWALEYDAFAFLVDLLCGIMGLTAGHITVVSQQRLNIIKRVNIIVKHHRAVPVHVRVNSSPRHTVRAPYML
jgi:hypothetical protein